MSDIHNSVVNSYCRIISPFPLENHTAPQGWCQEPPRGLLTSVTLQLTFLSALNFKRPSSHENSFGDFVLSVIFVMGWILWCRLFPFFCPLTAIWGDWNHAYEWVPVLQIRGWPDESCITKSREIELQCHLSPLTILIHLMKLTKWLILALCSFAFEDKCFLSEEIWAVLHDVLC